MPPPNGKTQAEFDELVKRWQRNREVKIKQHNDSLIAKVMEKERAAEAQRRVDDEEQLRTLNRLFGKSLQQEMQARQMAANTTHHDMRKRLEEARRNAEKSKEKAARAEAIRIKLPPLMLL